MRQHAVYIDVELGPRIVGGIVVIGQQGVLAGCQSAHDELQLTHRSLQLMGLTVVAGADGLYAVAHQLVVILRYLLAPSAAQRVATRMAPALHHNLYAVECHRVGQASLRKSRNGVHRPGPCRIAVGCYLCGVPASKVKVYFLRIGRRGHYERRYKRSCFLHIHVWMLGFYSLLWGSLRVNIHYLVDV